MKVRKCHDSPDCKSDDEITSYIDETEATLNLIILNSYFDTADYEQPIKTFVDDTFYCPFVDGFTKKTSIYLKRNSIDLGET